MTSVASKVERNNRGVKRRLLHDFSKGSEAEGRVASPVEAQEHMALRPRGVHRYLMVDHFSRVKKLVPLKRVELRILLLRMRCRRLGDVELVGCGQFGSVNLFSYLSASVHGVGRTVVMDGAHSIVSRLKLLDLVKLFLLIFVLLGHGRV